MAKVNSIIKIIVPTKTSILILNDYTKDWEKKLSQYLIDIRVIDNVPNSNTEYDCILCNNTQLHELMEQYSTLKMSDNCTIIVIDSNTSLTDSVLRFFKEKGYNRYPQTNEIICFQMRQSDWEIIQHIAQFCYTHIEPSKDNDKQDGYLILKDGYGLCGSSSRAARFLAETNGFQAKVATFRMEGLPFGRGESKWDTHTICEIKLKENDKWVVCDAMANICYPYSLQELLSNPDRADEYLKQIDFQPDERWEKRNYRWYSTSAGYKLAVSMKYPSVWFSKLKKTIQKLTH